MLVVHKSLPHHMVCHRGRKRIGAFGPSVDLGWAAQDCSPQPGLAEGVGSILFHDQSVSNARHFFLKQIKAFGYYCCGLLRKAESESWIYAAKRMPHPAC